MDAEATAAQTEERGDATRAPAKVSNFWQTQLALAEQTDREWEKDGQSIVERYKRERKAARDRTSRRFNILFSNTETIKAALYGKMPTPDVRRRFGDADPIARQAAEIIERSLIYCAEAYDVDRTIEAALHEYCLPGRGVMRIVYEPVIGQRPVTDPMTMAPIVGVDGNPLMEDFIADQNLYEKHVYWRDFRMSPARCWGDVWWVAFRHTMSREDLKASGFKEADTVPLNWEPVIDGRKEIPDSLKRAEVWEIWDKSRQERVWIVKGFDRPLRTDPDPYGLAQFFPLAEPLQAIADTETMVPTPEFNIYRDQADDLDELVSRISRLTKALKRRGVYDKAIKELARLSNASDNEFVPVEDWTTLSGKGGLEKVFETEDISMIAVVLKELYVQRDMLVQAIWEVLGIADIMRGVSDPGETLGAQELKAQFGGNRLRKRQRAVQKWIRDTYKLKAEIIAEHFEPQVLAEMTGIQQIDPQVIELLRSDKLRAYRIDIETDSTILEDDQAHKQAILELITGVATLIQQALPAIQQEPLLAPLMFELLGLGVRSVKEGRRIEEVIEQTQQAIMQKISQAMQNPQPPQDPKAEADMAKLEADRAEKERRFGLDKAKQDAELSFKDRELQLREAEHNRTNDQTAHEMDLKERDAALREDETYGRLGLEQDRFGHEREQAGLDRQRDQQAEAYEEEFNRLYDEIGSVDEKIHEALAELKDQLQAAKSGGSNGN